MKPLLEIQNIPIAIEYKTTRAQVSHVGKAKVETSRPNNLAKRGVAQARRAPQQPRPSVDTVDVNPRRIARVQQRPKTQATVSFYDNQGNSRSVKYDATARMGQGGQVMVDLQLNGAAEIADAAYDSAADAKMADSSLPESLSLTYQMEKLQFDIQHSGDGFEFTPASIEFSILEYPRVIIEYIGSPLYVPPSADPNYEPIDVLV